MDTWSKTEGQLAAGLACVYPRGSPLFIRGARLYLSAGLAPMFPVRDFRWWLALRAFEHGVFHVSNREQYCLGYVVGDPERLSHFLFVKHEQRRPS